MKKIFILLIPLLAYSEAHAFCEVKDLFPLSSQSSGTETTSGKIGGPTYTFNCPGSKMEIIRSPNTFQIRNLEQSDCGEDGLTLTPIFTAVIHFDADKAFYYDLKNNKHDLEVKCTQDEMFINLEDRPATWIDPWKPGPQQWRMRLQGAQVFVEYNKLYPKSFLRLKAVLQ